MIICHKKTIQATLLVAISAILYGFLGFLGTGVIKEDITISTMLFWRFFIAGSWILLFVVKKHASTRILYNVNPRILFLMFFLGGMAYAGSSLLYFIASAYTGTGLAMVIFFCYPIIVAFISWTTNKKILTKDIIAILIFMMIGLFFLRDSSNQPLSIIGIFCAIAAAACYAFYVMGSKHISSVSLDSNVLTMMVCFGCAFIFLILSVSTHQFVVPDSIRSWGFLIALGILATALPIQLMLEGLKYISSMRASIISVIEPLVTLSVGSLFLNELITPLQMLGIFVLVGSSVLVQFKKDL